MIQIVSLIYHIWEARNFFIFNKRDIPVSEVWRKAQNEVVNYKIANPPQLMTSNTQTHGMMVVGV